MHPCEGKLFPMLITARHFVKKAPILKYSSHLESRSSIPCVTFSISEFSKGVRPLSTFIPGSAFFCFIKSTRAVPSLVLCLIVSSKRITPPILFNMPSA